MCGRYLVEISEEELNGIVAAAVKNVAEHSEQFSFTFSGGEIFPGSIAPVITANNEVSFMTWGFPGIIAGRHPHINVRSETAVTSKTFGSAVAARRCLVPASAYYEWKTHDKKHKTKYEFTLPDQSPIYMAGIYSIDGRFAILTRVATPAIFEIHDRMPVIIPKSRIGIWLKESLNVLSEALTDLQFVPASASDKQSKQMSLFS
jgi:putative SOS response-associated peptidase YedK